MLSPALLTLPAAPTPPAAAPGAPAESNRAAIRQQALAFESVFLNTMLAPIFQSIPTDGPFGGGNGEEAWRGLLVERYADSMARKGGVGLADTVYRQLLAAQEGGTA